MRTPFTLAQANFPKVKYEYFDFHNECKHMRWDRIQGLLDRLDEDLTRYGYAHYCVNARCYAY